MIANTLQSNTTAAPYQLRVSTPLMVEEGALDRSAPPCTETGHLCRSYFFEGQANQTVSVMYSSEFLPYLTVVDPNGEVIAEGQVNHQGGADVELTTNGWYQLIISNVEASDRGNFIVSVLKAENSTKPEEVSQQ